ncbi:hypothetical protein NC653_002273 [Populus alba x Populus x berolinensis]|uniref:Uncharacterized protein n=1 Tax=Populus alba x Populus x berolinensis TaxID=444605 RepID=A0AAD6WGL9_9ROSI|nr:hypothetical protein NC653_002273 [Populus alba x Populus x berolinensis]
MMLCLLLLIPIKEPPILMSPTNPKRGLTKVTPLFLVYQLRKLHQSSIPIHSTEPEFTKKADGIVKIIFKKGESSISRPGIFSSFISMVQPAQNPFPVPVESFSKDSLPVYSFA